MGHVTGTCPLPRPAHRAWGGDAVRHHLSGLPGAAPAHGPHASLHISCQGQLLSVPPVCWSVSLFCGSTCCQPKSYGDLLAAAMQACRPATAQLVSTVCLPCMCLSANAAWEPLMTLIWQGAVSCSAKLPDVTYGWSSKLSM